MMKSRVAAILLWSYMLP